MPSPRDPGTKLGMALATDSDFYQPLHVAHIDEYLPSVEPYLSLPPVTVRFGATAAVPLARVE
ncbi:immunity protein Imm33 domain-containing protein [Massilia litorea]